MSDVFNGTKKSLLAISAISAFTLWLNGCSTGDVQGPPDFVPPPPEPDHWDVPTPDFSPNPDRPVITLNGEHTIYLPVNGTYEESGATANDLQDGDLSGQIEIENQVDTSQKGNYIVRYSVTDSSNTQALEVVRVVRVTDDEPAYDAPRPVGSTMSHMGYIEHLPTDYGRDGEQGYPLIIYNHGNAANADFGPNDPLAALSLLLENAGPPLLINAGSWDDSLPFIVLMPQAGVIEGSDPMARLNGFVDYAIQTYAVDTSRIYMTGWSQGGFISVDYGMTFPDKVAAVLALSAGHPFGDDIPDKFCNIGDVPLWLFHGDQDEVVDVAASIELYDRLNQDCQPTVAPKMTLLKNKLHLIHHSVFNLSAMQGGTLGAEHDPQYDAYDQSIYDWMLSHTTNR